MFQPAREPNSQPQDGGETIVSVVTQRLTSNIAAEAARKHSLSKKQPVPRLAPDSQEAKDCQTRIPVIIGEAHYKGMIPVDGILIGQIGAPIGDLGVRQKARSVFASQPELSGEITFEDTVRVNGHIAGTVYSKSGTLIVDSNATVEAHIDVAVAVIGGTVRGDIVARDRIEFGPCAIIHGNIWTRCLAIKDGAFFDGVSTMIRDAHTVK